MQLCLDKSDIPAHLLKYFKPKHVLKQKDDAGIPWRVAFALQADGWYLRSAMPWLKGSAGECNGQTYLCRGILFPANEKPEVFL